MGEIIEILRQRDAALEAESRKRQVVIAQLAAIVEQLRESEDAFIWELESRRASTEYRAGLLLGQISAALR